MMDSDMITWQDGVGHLPGSDLKFRLNELGLVEIDDDEAWQRLYDQTESGLSDDSAGAVLPRQNCEKVELQGVISTEVSNLPKDNATVVVKFPKSGDTNVMNFDGHISNTVENPGQALTGCVNLKNGSDHSLNEEKQDINSDSKNLVLQQPGLNFDVDQSPAINDFKTENSAGVGCDESVSERNDASEITELQAVKTETLDEIKQDVSADISNAETQQIDPQKLYDMIIGENIDSKDQSVPTASMKVLDKIDKSSESSDNNQKGESSEDESLPDITPLDFVGNFKPSVVKVSPVKSKSVSPGKAGKPSGTKCVSKSNKIDSNQQSPVVVEDEVKFTTLTSHFENETKPNGEVSNSSRLLPAQAAHQEEEPFDPFHRDSSNSMASDELPDIDPGPPCLRPRSRSRSLSPAFHLPPPTTKFQSSCAQTNLDGIPILKAESSSFQDKDIAFCRCCGCFGLSQEFYEFTFCTKACGDSYKYHSRSPDGKKKPSPTTPNKKTGGESGYHKMGDANGMDGGSVSPSEKSGGKKAKKKGVGTTVGKTKNKNSTVGKGKLKGTEANPGTSGSKNKRLQTKTKSTAFHSKDRKRNFPLVLSKRMPVSPERKLDDSRHKDVQLSPDITLGKSKISSKTSSGSSDFDWAKYLAETKSKSAPHRMFRQPAMPPQNPFRPGMLLESIDPQHQSLICVSTVIETQGYRVRLRFQGFSEAYDFWVNADSLDIFPAGWCEESSLELQPPPGAKEPFNWHQYLVENQLEAAPRHIFSITKEDFTIDSGVRSGMKMEAVDIRNQNLVCVATVAKVMGERILVHFDSWDSLYDYWTDLTSPFIHPVGWCDKNDVKLTPPNYCKSDFSWEKYLRETDTIAMPARLFRPLPPVGFRKGCKVECVDKRNPFLIRVATIAEVDQHNLIVHFDNWPSIYDFSVYELSPDIHPVGWCAHTGHPLQPPPPVDGSWKGPCTIVGCLGLGHIRGPKFLTHNSEKNCPYALHNYKKDWILADRITIYERNYGHAHNDNSSNVETAPKSIEAKNQVHAVQNQAKNGKSANLNSTKTSLPAKSAAIRRKRSSASSTKEVSQQKKPKVANPISPPSIPSPPAVLPSVQEAAEVVSEITKIPKSETFNSIDELHQEDFGDSTEESSQSTEVDMKFSPSAYFSSEPSASRQVISPVPSTSGVQNNQNCENSSDSAQRRLSIPSTTLASFPITSTSTAESDADYPPNYAANAVSLKSVIGTLNESTVSSWMVRDLARFIATIPGCEHTADRFLDQLIDGESFLMLSQHDFINVMGLKLGPAIKLCNVIRMINFNSVATNYKST